MPVHLSLLLLVICSFFWQQGTCEKVKPVDFYVRPSHNQFARLGRQVDTDKVTVHNYDTLYAKYFELMHRNRFRVQRVFEIGLGCDSKYGPGHSAKLWRKYFPNAEIWMAEFDAKCVAKHQQALKDLGIKVVTGDQADFATLRSWINTTGGKFDVIIDDGGHTSMQQYNSLVLLFLHALRPGGIYVLEDMQVAHHQAYIDGDKQHIITDVVKDMLVALIEDPGDGGVTIVTKPRWGLLPGLKMIDCQRGACVFTKCFVDDARCDNPRYDQSLLKYGMGP